MKAGETEIDGLPRDSSRLRDTHKLMVHVKFHSTQTLACHVYATRNCWYIIFPLTGKLLSLDMKISTERYCSHGPPSTSSIPLGAFLQNVVLLILLLIKTCSYFFCSRWSSWGMRSSQFFIFFVFPFSLASFCSFALFSAKCYNREYVVDQEYVYSQI